MDDAELLDFDYLVWTRDDNMIESCMKACQQQGYMFAGLKVRTRQQDPAPLTGLGFVINKYGLKNRVIS